MLPVDLTSFYCDFYRIQNLVQLPVVEKTVNRAEGSKSAIARLRRLFKRR